MSGCTQTSEPKIDFDDLQGRFADGSCGSLSVVEDSLVLDGRESRFDIMNVEGDNFIVASPTVRFEGQGTDCKLMFVDEPEYLPVHTDRRRVSIDIQSAKELHVSRFYKTGT